MLSYRALTLLALALPSMAESVTECVAMSEIYTDGADLVERMWGGAFECVADEARGYTMWHFEDDNNPNDAVSALLGHDVPTECEVEYFHKTAPSPEGDDFTECHPWKKEACCTQATVATPKAINEAYGKGFEWDRCGKMSEACQRFFVQEACFYECEVNIGNFRKYTDSQAADSDHEGFENKWQIHAMPIKMSYCNAFYDACRNDFFCAAGGFWECEVLKHPNEIETVYVETEVEVKGKGKTKKELPMVVLAVILIAGVVLCGFTAFVVGMEMQGKPAFAPLVPEGPAEPDVRL